MRKIEFRGKRLDNGEWVVGNLIQGDQSFIEGLEVDPETVGQFTGLHDTDGTEIYEGDVVDFVAYDAIGNERGKEQGVVRFEFCGYQIGGYDMYDVLLNDDEVEIIGNIHDNPELIRYEQFHKN